MTARVSFVDDHGAWGPAEQEAASAVISRLGQKDIDTVRLCFVDPHGLLKGKAITADLIPSVFRTGMTVVSTLLSKDTSGRTAFSAFSPDGGVRHAEMGGAGDMVMVPDPKTFKILPWADRTAWMICDLRFKTGAVVPFCSRSALRSALSQAAQRGFDLMTGLEVEFHIYRPLSSRLGSEDINRPGLPGRPDDVESLDRGYHLLSQDRADALEPLLSAIGQTLRQLEIPLRTTEIEYGPSQVELTMAPQLGLKSADDMVLLRSAVKQVARSKGYHATFMCRPQAPQACSSGWHLHQSLIRRDGDSTANAFQSDRDDTSLSPTGLTYVGGLLRHARAACVFAVPTVNGYKRFQPFSMAPDRVLWAHDNRAAMIRVVGSPRDPNAHVENRVGEPAANPHLYIASQLAAGLDGVNQSIDPGPSADQPYATEATRLPATLREAVDALDADKGLRRLLSEELIDHYVGLKRAEVARFDAAVTDWEQREYFHLY